MLTTQPTAFASCLGGLQPSARMARSAAGTPAPTHPCELHNVPRVVDQVLGHPRLLRAHLQLLLGLKGQPEGVLVHAPGAAARQLLQGDGATSDRGKDVAACAPR